jgi:hypothetical protein
MLVALLRRAAPKAALKLEPTLRALERTPATAGRLKLLALALKLALKLALLVLVLLLVRFELIAASAAAAACAVAEGVLDGAAGRCCAGKCTVIVPAPAAGLDL